MRKLGKRIPDPHVYIATPAYDGRIYTDYALSAFETGSACGQVGMKLTATVMGNGAFIELSRNTFVQMFLKTDCTHFMFIDADLKWEPRGVLNLVLANRPICAGMYRRRQEPEDYPITFAENPHMGGLWVRDGHWVLCNRVPTGFLCIRRDVIEEMAAEADIMVQPSALDFPELPWLFGTKNDRSMFEEGSKKFRFTGEDFTFCDAYVKKYNDPIPVLADLDFSHAGYKCNFYKYLARVAAGEVVPPRDDSTRINGEMGEIPTMEPGQLKALNEAAPDNSGGMTSGRMGLPENVELKEAV